MEEAKFIKIENGEKIDKSVILDETETEEEQIVYIRPKTKRCFLAMQLQKFCNWLFPVPKSYN
ncbi:hypothetical protein EHP00_445 [Ecytonucleospora hepatopenaei]|uniref:Uncharacterized protein n=1 Tax=Ecytonucleospora hepatopenaei TaxID=646526 RepID=A0A1W0E8Z2_9MICR|nr:hypothetical protein EHP00_445 [Ecytonucleospora hepatopenaei]